MCVFFRMFSCDKFSRFLVGYSCRPMARFSSQVPTSLIKQLRDQTGAPILDVKKALESSNNDLAGALKFLRERGISMASKLSASRTANQGMVGVSCSADSLAAAMVELRSETDFVARNELFQGLVSDISASILQFSSSNQGALVPGSVDDFPVSSTQIQGETVESQRNLTISTALSDAVVVLREKIEVGRASRLSVENGIVSSYVHNPLQPGVGENAAIIAIESDSKDIAALKSFGHRLAMHVVAAAPRYLDRDSVPQSVVDEKRSEFLQEISSQNKPEAVAERIVQGKLTKFFQEICLLDQIYLLDEVDGAGESAQKRSVAQVLNDKEKEMQVKLSIKAFARFKVGEA